MSQVWGWALVLWLAAVSTAAAQSSGMVGLPLVNQKDGWARYTASSPDGPTELVFKVGAPGNHKGKKGQWYILEVEAPGVGRIAVHFLVAGTRFSPDHLLLVRAYVPGQEPQEQELPKGPVSALTPARLVRKHTETVAGHELEVTEYALGGTLTAGWSPAVPGLGITSISGEQSLRLVAFGVGGDPWKGAGSGLPQWPKPEPGAK